jgi:small subunit ribosomal protein S16
MVRIRLRKTGGRNQPSYRIVAADKRSPRDGRFLEILGHYNPRTEPATIDVKEDRLFDWLKKGADPSGSVVRVLKSIGTWDRWLRFKEGESLETLLEEATAEAEARQVDPRTKRQDFIRSKPSKKAAAKAEAEAEAGAPGEAEQAEEPEPPAASEEEAEAAAEPADGEKVADEEAADEEAETGEDGGVEESEASAEAPDEVEGQEAEAPASGDSEDEQAEDEEQEVAAEDGDGAGEAGEDEEKDE